MVQVAVSGSTEFQCTETDIVQGLVVNAECFIRVFNELMNRERGIVWFYNGI